MTRKEAITNLNMISVAFVEPVTKGQKELIDDTFNMAIKALELLTSYEQTINKLTEAISEQEPFDIETYCKEHFCVMVDKDVWDKAEKALEQESKWISVNERLPEELEPVNITWVNHDPESYYADIKDKPFTATGVHFNGQWYWWSTLCADILAEYSHNYDDIIDDDIEITAWKPLPNPYEPKGVIE